MFESNFVQIPVQIKNVSVHHIKHLDEFPELAFKNDNLISLCEVCHAKEHPEKLKQKKVRKWRE